MSLAHFQVIRPCYEVRQEEILQWIAKAHVASEAKVQGWPEQSVERSEFYDGISERLLRIGCGADKVQMRGVQIPDCLHTVWPKMEIYNLEENCEGARMEKRASFFATAADGILEQFYPESSPPPAHLIHVTCTGYVSPSCAQRMVSKRRWGHSTLITHAYHMGCYASIPALRVALGSLPQMDAVDIVHTELCSLHMNPALHDLEQLVVQTLFADGFIKYSMVPADRGALKVLALHEEVLADSDTHMSWSAAHWGMRMSLTKEVPLLLANAISPFFERLVQKAGQSFADVQGRAHFAIHPGGPKVIQQIAERLGLTPAQIRHSTQVFNERGNMSSATLPHIWEAMARDPQVGVGDLILSVAFGPGLCIAGAVFVKQGGV